MADRDPRAGALKSVVTGSPMPEQMMPEQMASVLVAQRAAQLAEMPVPAAARRDRLKRVIALLADHADALAQALSSDFGHRSHEQSLFTDVASSIRQAKHALKHLDHWMAPERRKVDFPLNLLGAKARIDYQPKGVIGIIAPWNFPVQLTMGPLVGAFAAGNRVMVKTSEFTPAVGDLLAGLAARHFDETEVAFFSGGPEVGQAFAALPFDHLVFTGATSIARHILHAAADNLVPVTLELGGKSPTIIGQGADLARATERIALGKLMNAGQICLAPDYLLVPNGREDEVVAGLQAAACTMYPTLLANPDYTSVLNARHRDRLLAIVEDARIQGARVIEVNPASEDFAAAHRGNDPATANRLPLFILTGVSDAMRVMREELFGPVLPIMTYRTMDEAIAYINAHDRPLGLYYFGTDMAEQKKVLARTVSGGVTINDVIFHTSMEDLPFGGIGPSGMGAYHGIDGFRTFSHARAVYTQSKLDVAGLAGFKPPYGAKLNKMLKREIG